MREAGNSHSAILMSCGAMFSPSLCRAAFKRQEQKKQQRINEDVNPKAQNKIVYGQVRPLPAQ